jgi:tRNA(Ile)-lysidine synthase
MVNEEIVIETIRKLIQKHQLILPDETIIVGVSGGADSLALMHILYTLQFTLGFHLCVATLDHGLRGEQGAADAEYVRQTATLLNVPVTVGRSDVRQLAADHHMGIEAAARLARYDFLAKAAREVGAKKVAVAHHAGDQAETVLMHLLRGSGLRGLGGMALESSLPGHPDLSLVRALLGNTRTEIEAYCQEHDLQPREDVTNSDTTYLRNNLRLNILPLLEKLNPHVQRGLGQLATIAQVENDYLQKQLNELTSTTAVKQSGERIQIERAVFRELHPAMQRRLIDWSARQIAPNVEDLDYQHIVAAAEFGLHGKQGGRVLLTDGLQLRIEYDVLILEYQNAPILVLDQPLLPEAVTLDLQIPGVIHLPDSPWMLNISLNGAPDDLSQYAPLLILEGVTLTLRSRREGDRFAPLGMGGHSQKLNRWMINRKIPRHLRERIPLICVDDEIAAIYIQSQWFISESSYVNDNSPRVVYFRFLQNS